MESVTHRQLLLRSDKSHSGRHRVPLINLVREWIKFYLNGKLYKRAAYSDVQTNEQLFKQAYMLST